MSQRALVLVAAAVLRHEGRILLTRRMKGAHLAGLWEFPGGKVEPGEDPEATVVRECREECAIEVEVLDIVEVAHHAYEEKEVLLLFYECRFADPSAGTQVQHLGVAEHAWVLPTQLGDYPLPPPDARLVRKLEARG